MLWSRGYHLEARSCLSWTLVCNSASEASEAFRKRRRFWPVLVKPYSASPIFPETRVSAGSVAMPIDGCNGLCWSHDVSALLRANFHGLPSPSSGLKTHTLLRRLLPDPWCSVTFAPCPALLVFLPSCLPPLPLWQSRAVRRRRLLTAKRSCSGRSSKMALPVSPTCRLLRICRVVVARGSPAHA